MTIAAAVQNAASGDNTLTHSITAATLGGGFSAIAVWGFQLAHLDPPAAVSQALTSICMVGASWIMQKLA